MKRVVAVLAGTIAGLGALLSYKSGTVRRVSLGLGSQSALPAGSTATAAPPSPSIPASGENGGGQGVDDNGNPIAPTPPPTTSAPAAAVPAGSRVLTGPDVPNRYGDVQVQVTVAGGKIIDVKPLLLPFDRSRSAEISQIAGPMLRAEVLQVQGANIDIISGATYTSQSYAQSVQAALDQARA